MPRCFGCKESVPSGDLQAVGDELYCSTCRELRVEPARAEEPTKEVTMSRDQKKAVASIEIYRNEMEDDYDIVGFVRISGIKIEIDTNMNKVRDFFTKRSMRKERRLAQAEGYKRDPQSALS